MVGKGENMNRQERLDLTADVYASWIAKYDDIPGFDPDYPTAEQETDYLAIQQEMGLPIGSTSWQKTVDSMTEEQIQELLASPAYQKPPGVR